MSRSFFITFTLAVGIHIGGFGLAAFWGGLDKEAEVHFTSGKSAIKLTMLPSIPQKKIQKEKPPVKKVEQKKEMLDKSLPLIKEFEEEVKKKKQENPKEIKPIKKPPGKKEVVKASVKQVADLKKKGVNREAHSLSTVKGKYPEASRRAGHEGTVIYLVEVLVNGRAGSIQLAVSSGYKRLDDAAKKALLEAKYSPALKNGDVVKSKILFPIKFQLNDSKK